MEDTTRAEFAGTIIYLDTEVEPPRISTNWLCIKNVRTIDSLSKIEKAFLGVCLTSMLITIVITIYRLATVDATTPFFILEVIILVNILFCVYYQLTGIFFERQCELGCIMLSSFVLSGYVLSAITDTITGIAIFRGVVSGAHFLCAVIIGCIITIGEYYNADSLIFRSVGTATELRDSCRSMFYFFGSLKLNLQNSLSLALWTLAPLANMHLAEQIVFPLVNILSISSNLCGYLMARYEKKFWFIVYVILWIVMPVFATYTIVKIVRWPEKLNNSKKADVSFVKSLFMAVMYGLACWAMQIYSLVLSNQVYRNFGKGLKEKEGGWYITKWKVMQNFMVNSHQAHHHL